MKRSIQLIFLTSLFFGISLFGLKAQVSHGKVIEGLTLESKLLDKKMRYSVYLPFDYESSQRYYPVVYLLHGYSDNDMGWIQFGEVNRKVDKAIAEGEIPPMVIVMPDGELTWYINNHDNSVPYEDYFFQEFIPHIETSFRIRKQERYRGIAGLSMGGFGSLVYSMKHPEMFSACAALSAAITPPKDAPELDQERWDNAYGPVYGKGLQGEERLTNHFLENNPFHLAKNRNNDKLKEVRYYLDCGDDDFLSTANNLFHNVLVKERIPHEYRMRDGTHSWSYWRSGIIDGLKFIGESFHK